MKSEKLLFRLLKSRPQPLSFRPLFLTGELFSTSHLLAQFDPS